MYLYFKIYIKGYIMGTDDIVLVVMGTLILFMYITAKAWDSIADDMEREEL